MAEWPRFTTKRMSEHNGVTIGSMRMGNGTWLAWVHPYSKDYEIDGSGETREAAIEDCLLWYTAWKLVHEEHEDSHRR